MDLNPENVFSLLRSTNDFPVDFDDAWQWIGYTRKDNAKAALLNAGFVEGIDFQVSLNIQGNSKGGRPSEQIYLTIDCFKSFAMMAGTARGREVRQYFLDCEKQLKSLLLEHQATAAINKRLLDATHQVYLLDDPVKWKDRGRVFQEDFYNQVYRLKVRERPNRNHPVWMANVTINVVYERLQPGLWDELCVKNPRINGRRKYCCHQFLSDNIGNPHLRSHLYAVTRLMKGCQTWKGFMMHLDQFHPKTAQIQMDLLFDLFAQSPEDFETWKRLVS